MRRSIQSSGLSFLILMMLFFNPVYAKQITLGVKQIKQEKQFSLQFAFPTGTIIVLPDTAISKKVYRIEFRLSDKHEWVSIRKKIESLELQYPVESVNYRFKDRKRILELEITLASPTRMSVASGKKDIRLNIGLNESVTDVVESDQKRKTLADGALHRRQYADAIKLYSSLLSTSNVSLKKQATEMLGLAREKNGQLAHAKLVYQQFLKDYPEDAAASRVRQRLADLLSGQFNPVAVRQTTKQTQRVKRKDPIFNSAFNQIVAVSGNDHPFQERPIEQALVISSIDMTARFKKGGSVSRLIFYSDHVYDLAENINDGFDIQSLYYEFRLPKDESYLSLGRQNSHQGGIIGRFDGVAAAHKLARKWQLELLSGFPVDYGLEDEVQKRKRFVSANISYKKESYTFRPYSIVQRLDGITDRLAIGEEFDLFNESGFVRQSFDYDVHFKQWNLFSLQGNYRFKNRLSSYFIVDWRRSPLLESSNALINEFRVDTILELQEILSEELILEQAKQRTGKSFFITAGGNIDFTKDAFVRFDLSYSQQEYSLFFDEFAESEKDAQYESSMQAGLLNIWKPADDMLVWGLRLGKTARYSNYESSLRYRFKPTHRFSVDQQWKVNLRQSDPQQVITLRPSFKLSYQWEKTVWNQVEFGYEFWKYRHSVLSDYQRAFVNVVYRYIF